MTILIEENDLLELLEANSYMTSQGRRKLNVSVHQMLWEIVNNKKIPEGHVLHHIDENPLNNSLDNLRLMTRSDHMSLHKKGKILKNYYRVVSKGDKWRLVGPAQTYIRSSKNKEMLEMMADEMNSY